MANREFQVVAQLLPVVAWESDPRGALSFISDRWTELTGQRAADALGHGWRRHIVEDDLPVLDGAARDAGSHRLPVDVEVRVVDVANTRRWMRLVATPDVRGNVVVGFVGLIIDVTAQRQAAADLAEREVQLRLVEARHRALLESLPDLLFQFDAEGRFVDFQASRDAQPLLSPDRFLGRTVHEVLPAPIAELTVRALDRARETGEPQRLEYELAPGSGDRRDYEARLSPMRSGGFLALVRDVTELKRAERELIAAREQAVSASTSKSQFLANVSHEIRTPLNGVIGVTQLMRNHVLPEEVREYVGVLESAGESLLALVNEVLDLSRIEANRLELAQQPFDLPALVGQASRGFLAEARRKRLELVVELGPLTNGVVVGDEGRVRQIVNNLVSNAIKFTSAGSVHVRLTRGPDDGAWVLSVTDTGQGIAAARLETIFEPFAPATVPRQSGTGLGLSIARRLALLMGGDLSVRSVEGQGSTFEARLPLPAGQAAKPAPRVPVARRLSVLLVEDNEVNARLTRAMLEWLGHQVETVGDGREALATTAARAFDLVIMDVQLPHLDGLATTRALREREAGQPQHLPVVALTANAMKADELACLAAGMDAYLAKPVTVEALADVIAWFAEGVRGTTR
ncbi:MAG: response regulator [Myxococcaceae bacterium]|nr:response regulator [Myxococcaceae bacterium]